MLGRCHHGRCINDCCAALVSVWRLLVVICSNRRWAGRVGDQMCRLIYSNLSGRLESIFAVSALVDAVMCSKKPAVL